MLKVTSHQNPQVQAVRRLKTRRERDKTGRFLIEGYRELSRAIAGRVVLETLLFSPALFLGENESFLIDAVAERGGKTIEVTEGIFEKLSYRDRPDGLVAIAVQMKGSLGAISSQKEMRSLFVVAEGIEKPGNLGSIMRSCDGGGVNGIIVCDRCTDIFNPNVVRASVGTLFTQPVVEAGGEETLHWLKERGVQIVATSPAAHVEYTDIDLRGPTAIVVGSEQLGLSTRWLEGSDALVSIPMKGVADSLNVATATSLLLYEALRQRR